MVAPAGIVHWYEVAPAMAGMLYETPVAPAQTDAGPVIIPAAAGNGLTVTAKAGEAAPFPQPLVPETVMFPDTAPVPKLTVIFLVPEPDAMTAPAGSVQVYDVALRISLHEYATPFVPAQTDAVPVTGPAAFGNGFTKRLYTVGVTATHPYVFV